MLKNDILKSGTSSIGFYGSAPPLGILGTRRKMLFGLSSMGVIEAASAVP